MKGKEQHTYKGKTAIVTGAASGIGKQLAIMLADMGCNLALVDISENGLAETHELINHDIICSLHVANLSNLEDVRKLKEDVKTTHIHIHFLFNIAGIAHGGRFWEMYDETIEKWSYHKYVEQSRIICS